MNCKLIFSIGTFLAFTLAPLPQYGEEHLSWNNNCALLLTQSGKVFAIGKSSDGCLGLGEVTETAEPVELKELSGVAGVCVCGSWGDALAYTSEGKVYVWGNNVSWKRPQLVPELTDVVDARCRAGHYLALTKSGKLYEWRGVHTYIDTLDTLSTTPKVVTLNAVITSIACGPYHSLALTKDGQVYSWGKKYNSWTYVYQPMTQILLPETVAKISCGAWHSLVLTHSGKLYTWGYNVFGGLGDPSGRTESATPLQVGQNIGRFVDIAVNGFLTNAAVSNTGAVYMWGRSENGAEVNTPTKTAYFEMHLVFANISGTYSWTPNTPSSNTVVVKDSSSVAGKLKASCNDEDLSQLENKETEEQIDNVDAVPPLSCSTPSPSSTPITKLAASQDDQYDNLGKHVASQLREMPLRSFIILQDKINGLITKERLRLCESDLSQLENKETEEQIDNVDAVPPLSYSTPSPSSTPITKLAASQDDQYDNFGKHVASQLREMPLRSFIILQDKINGLITKERLRLCESVSETSPSSIPLSSTSIHTDSTNYDDDFSHLFTLIKRALQSASQLPVGLGF